MTQWWTWLRYRLLGCPFGRHRGLNSRLLARFGQDGCAVCGRTFYVH